MLKIALIGRDISYTRSPEIHVAIGKAFNIEIDCEVCDVTFDNLENTLTHLLYTKRGIFVTKPYKAEVARLMGAEINSVNVVRCVDNEAISTDGWGFLLALERNFPEWKKEVSSVLVLGAGGAASTVAESLTAVGKKVYILNRTALHAAKLCSATGAELYVNQPCEMIVNCTSVGTNGEDVLKSLCVLPDGFRYAFDLIYSPEQTAFLKRCAAAGARTANGYDMLVYQAIEGDKFLLLSEVDTERIFDDVKQILSKQM